MQSNRRDFLKGCAAAAAVTTSGGHAMAWFDPAVTTGAKSAANGNVLVYIFLRGAIDGLHMVVPYAGSDRTAYETKRAGLAISTSRLRRIGTSNWGWHPRAGGAPAMPSARHPSSCRSCTTATVSHWCMPPACPRPIAAISKRRQ